MYAREAPGPVSDSQCCEKKGMAPFTPLGSRRSFRLGERNSLISDFVQLTCNLYTLLDTQCVDLYVFCCEKSHNCGKWALEEYVEFKDIRD